jgi:hypothetical protein
MANTEIQGRIRFVVRSYENVYQPLWLSKDYPYTYRVFQREIRLISDDLKYMTHLCEYWNTKDPNGYYKICVLATSCKM